jgi:hypothetical protein
LCLDCDKLDRAKRESGKKQAETEQETRPLETKLQENENDLPTEPSTALAPDEIPPFLANALVVKESWLANHVNLLAILVLVLGILVAIVVFR